MELSEEEKKAIEILNKFITKHELFNIKQSDNLEGKIKKFLQISSNSDYVYGSSSDYVYGSNSDYVYGSSSDYVYGSSSDYVYGSSSDYVYGSSSDYGIKNFNGKTIKKIHEENNNGGQENG